MVMLGIGDPIPSDLENRPCVTWINEYYSKNLHLLPQEAVQAKFSANLLKDHGQGTLKEENSSLFAQLESINEDDEALGSLREKENPEEAELGRYIEMLQARKKEMASRKKKMASRKKKMDLPKPV